MPNLSRYPDFNNDFGPDQQNVANFLRDIKTNFQSGTFVPTYQNVSGILNGFARFQRVGSILFVSYKLNCGGSYSVSVGDVLKLPLKPLQGNGVNFLPQNSFTYAPLGTSAVQHWYLDTTSQYIR